MAISKFKLKDSTKKMALAMPKNCRCPICEATRQKIKNEVGEKNYLRIARELVFAS